jgi:hypothetical protein
LPEETQVLKSQLIVCPFREDVSDCIPGGNGLVLDAVSRLGVVEGGDGFVYRQH